ncbi:hypothetical protein H0I76_05120 [Limibaculum sp. M0105]|uniref:histidine kinase n=1 Tax=Thermohalobaculum xanthum TaxID=2753746 RepID=A0A8J7M6R3_9RHOB|nr:histidine kinase dimerization/phospho-acceptor domain-containing protein [Thermohalobaculum xanthum]MBK0398559.1 hypothetical protein [Thermohalobaculum xanthum]
MKQSFSITRTLFLFALLGALVAAGIALRAQQQSSEGLERASQESLFWSAVQVEVELSRFAATLGQFALGPDGTSGETVNERFDILWSRVLLFQEGDVGRRLAALDHSGVVDRLFEEMKRHEDAIVSIDDEPPAKVRAVLQDFLGYGDELRALSIRVIRAEENRLAEVRGNVRNSSYLALAAVGAVLAIVLTLVLLLLIESRRYRAMAQASAALAERAEAASRMKSRFLTMMSHELRTPMNGVMGMLALVRQTQLSDAQSRLIEQAQRSGTQMVTLLSDMLDLSDLQSEKQVIGSETFALTDLCAELKRHLAPRIERAGLAVRCEVASDVPPRVVGDFVRLRQALIHLLSHMIEIVGSPELVLRIGHDDGWLSVEIDAAVHGREQAGWQPEEMLGRGRIDYGSFASDSLAPMIAQGLIELMGGQIVVERPTDGRASVRVSVPAARHSDEPRTVRIDVQSRTLAAVLGALVQAEGWHMHGSGASEKNVDAVIYAADDPSEVETILRMRARFPSARIIAAGAPSHPEIFDAVCPLPVNRAALVRALEANRTTGWAVS